MYILNLPQTQAEDFAQNIQGQLLGFDKINIILFYPTQSRTSYAHFNRKRYQYCDLSRKIFLQRSGHQYCYHRRFVGAKHIFHLPMHQKQKHRQPTRGI